MQNSQDWYQKWFDTPYYALLYRNHDEKEAELLIDHLLNKLHLQEGSSILDMPCGEGRHAFYLWKKGYKVLGIDLSREMILRAKNKEGEGLEFLAQDMRTPVPGNHYDLALNLYTSFGYFKTEVEDLEVLKSIHKALKDGGRMVLDFLNIHKVLPNLVEFETRIINGIRYDIEREVEGGYLFKNIMVTEKNRTENYFERLRTIGEEDFRSLFEKSGFGVLESFGNYELSPFNSDSSDRLIFMLEKI